MAHYIFIHGGWRNSDCWKNILTLMEKRDASASAIDLPGHGKNKADFNDVTLKSYVDTVVAEANKYEDVILVGHSMGGIVISEVVERIPKKIKKLIFISAIIPKNGHSLIGRTRTFSQEGIKPYMIFNFEESYIDLKKGQALRDLFMNDCDEIDIEKDEKTWELQPMKPFSDKVHIGKGFREVPKLYVKCTLDKCILKEDQNKMAVESGCSIVELKSGHSPYLSSPKELSKTILKIS